MLGLYAYVYLVLHLLAYAVIDQGLDARTLIEDVLKRPWITLGATALLLLTPLAVTSTRGWMRRLGRRWQRLHYLVYPATLLGLWHFWWQVKRDVTEPLIYAAVFAALMAWRTVRARRRRVAATAAGAGAATTAPVGDHAG
jgi:sulfoxide reductase heme-binding subunit YedZ